MKKTLFLVFSACIVVFSIISICTAPIINGVLKDAGSWGTLNCKYQEDLYKRIKDDKNYPNRDTELEAQKKEKNKCNRQKAMYGLEYSALILDITLGFICAVLGLLHYFDVAKPFEKITGIIGLSTGVISFVLTLVYICYSGYIFTKQIPTSTYDSTLNTNIFKLDKEGAYAKKEGNQFKCLYYKNNKENSGYAKFSDLGKRQYNYEKKRHYPEDNSKYTKCGMDPSISNFCESVETIDISPALNTYKDCDYLYLTTKASDFKHKYLFDMWVTTIIFTCLICVCAIGLAIFGFLLFKNSDGSGL
jgi:hypothetical protein